MKFPLICGVNTSSALSLRAWGSDASICSNSSMSATMMSPFQIPPRKIPIPLARSVQKHSELVPGQSSMDGTRGSCQAKHAQLHPNSSTPTSFQLTLALLIPVPCCIFEGNEVVINMIIKGRSFTMRRVPHTHRVALDWLFDNNLEPRIQIRCIGPKYQFADILTKGNSTHVGLFSSLRCTKKFSLISCITTAKRIQEQKKRKGCVQVATSSDEYLILSYVVKFLCRFKSDCIEKSGDVWSFGETR